MSAAWAGNDAVPSAKRPVAARRSPDGYFIRLFPFHSREAGHHGRIAGNEGDDTLFRMKKETNQPIFLETNRPILRVFLMGANRVRPPSPPCHTQRRGAAERGRGLQTALCMSRRSGDRPPTGHRLSFQLFTLSTFQPFNRASVQPCVQALRLSFVGALLELRPQTTRSGYDRKRGDRHLHI